MVSTAESHRPPAPAETISRGNLVHDEPETQESIHDFDRRFREVSRKVHEHVNITFNQLHVASRGETEKLLEGLNYIQKEEDLKGWEGFCKTRMRDMQQAAHKLYKEEFMGKLQQERGKTISERTIRELEKKFFDENADYKQKEKYVRDTLPKRIAEWKLVKERRDKLKQNPEFKRLTSSQVPKLDAFNNDAAFLNLTYPERKGLVDLVDSLLKAKDNGMEAVHKSVKATLEGYVQDGRMHRSKVGTWLNRIFTDNATPDQVKDFMKDVVEPYAENWKEVRHRFNKANKEMNLNKVPRGLNRLSLNDFLLLEYEQRVTYVDEVESRMEGIDPEKPKKLTAFQLDIRHALDSKDWIQAESLLVKAKKDFPDEKSFRSMEQYLETHRTDEEDEGIVTPEAATNALAETRAILARIPSNMKSMTVMALNDPNPAALSRLWQVFYNRHWVIANGYSNAYEDMQQSHDEMNKEQTEERIEDGHDWTFERNVIKGDTATDAAIRNECVKPQVLYTNRSGISTIYKSISTNAENAQFGYWTTIVDDDVPYDALRQALDERHALKRNARIMRKAGMMYSDYGKPTSLN